MEEVNLLLRIVRNTNKFEVCIRAEGEIERKPTLLNSNDEKLIPRAVERGRRRKNKEIIKSQVEAGESTH